MGDFEKHNGRSIRLKGYDYSEPGDYFVTICTKNFKCLFGDVVNSEMVLNKYGEIVQECWLRIPQHFKNIYLDEFIVMPNHIQGIITILCDDNVGARHAVPLQEQREHFGKPTKNSIPTIVRSFKSAVTKRINILRKTLGQSIWQRGYYEHIIRDEKALNEIRIYIISNPSMWELDRNLPRRQAGNLDNLKFIW